MEITTAKQKDLYQLIIPKIITALRSEKIKFENATYVPGASKGEAILGKILEVIVLGKKFGGMQTRVHFVVKFAVENFLREQLPIEVIYAREIFMYKYVFPVFLKVQEELPHKFMGFPKYFDSDSSATPEYIIMNDMKCEGYTTVDRTEPLNIAHALIAVRAYAQLHALSLAVRQKDSKKYAEWKTKMQTTFYSSMQNTDITFIKIHCERALQTLDPQTHGEVLEKFRNLDSVIFEKMKAASAPNAAENFKVICHGDCSITNIMFKFENRENLVPTNAALVDFQMSKLGSPALDLSHLFFLCTDKKLRDKSYTTLLNEYCIKLSSFCKELNVDVEFSLDTLQDHMKRFSIYGLYMAVTNLYMKMSCDDEIPSVESFSNVSDAEAKIGHQCFKKEEFENRIRDVLIDFHNYGYIV